MATAQQLANQLTENELLYLYIANEIWAMSEVWDDAEISDIEDTGGTFDSSKNELILDYEEVRPFDQEHVQNVIDAWKEYVAAEENLPTTGIIDKLLFPGAMHTDFQNVVVHVTGETGSYEDLWKPRGDDEVSVMAILEAGGVDRIAQEKFSV